MTDDCPVENTAPDGTRFVGREAVGACWQRFLERAAFGNRCIVRWIYRKTKDGARWLLGGVDLFRVRDGKVAEKPSYVKG